MVQTVGAVTMGQTPRDDIVPELEAALGPGYEIEQVGVLDGLSAAEIEAQSGRSARGRIVTRLRDGREVRVRHKLVTRRFQECVEDLDGRVAMILVLCTGDLPQVETRVPMLYPGRLLQGLTASLGVERLGVLTPAAGQIRPQRRRWRSAARRVFVADVSPYGPPEAFEQAAERLERKRVEVVVLDCIGYTQAMQRRVRDRLHVPALASLSVLGRIAAEMLASPELDPPQLDATEPTPILR